MFEQISTRVETFQDLSLPIPSRDHVHMLHQGTLTPQQKGGLSACSDVYSGDQVLSPGLSSIIITLLVTSF
jgi:hypothetical protein